MARIRNIDKPTDLLDVYNKLEQEGTLSVNAIRKYYNISSPSVVIRWLNEINLTVINPCTNKESYISDINQLITDILSEKFSFIDIKAKYNINTRTLKRICLKNNINISSVVAPNWYENTSNVEEFIDTVKQHGKMYAASKYKVTLSTISGSCKRLNIDVEKYKGLQCKKLDNQVTNMIIQDAEHMSFSGIYKKYGISPNTIKKMLNENGITKESVTEKWKEDYSNILDNLENYVTQNKQGKTLLDISSENNISIEHLKKAFKSNNIPVVLHSYNKSNAEIELKNFLNSLTSYNFQSVKIHYNSRRFELDCYCKNLKIAFEYNGMFWHSTKNIIDKNYHIDKTKWCKEQGIRLVHIFEHEWLYKQDLVKSRIKSILGINNKIFARKCYVQKISSDESRSFMNKNHIQGNTNSPIRYGLFYKDELVSCMTFSKSRFNQKYQFELVRYCSIQGYNVVGGASKILSQFIKDWKPSTIVSYCDLRWNTGNLYTTMGFALSHTSPPNYWYFNIKTGELESRMKYQKHKLSKLLENFDKNLTEEKNMDIHNFFKLYDCGSDVYIMNIKK